MNRTVRLIVAVAAGVVLLGGSFYGGMVVGKNQAGSNMLVQSSGGPLSTQGMPQMDGQGGMAAGQGGADRGDGQGAPMGGAQGGMVVGEISAVGDGELTITDSAGASTIVKVGDTTLIEKQSSVTLSDLEVGETVVVSGNKADDGSVTARSLQVAPAGRVGGADAGGTFGGGAPGGGGPGGAAPGGAAPAAGSN